MRPREYLIPIYLWISASVLLHMFLAGGTKAIADRLGGDERRLLAQAGAGSNSVSEVEFELGPTPPPPPVVPSLDPTASPTPTTTPTPTSTHRRPPRERDRRPPPRREPDPPPAPPPPPPPPVVATPVVPVVVPRGEHHFVDQNNAAEEPVPTDPHFLAQANRNVEEETQAAQRNLVRDQANPRSGGPRDRTDPTNPGRNRDQVSADLDNHEGRSDRVPNQHPRDESHVAAAAVRPNPTPAQGTRAPGTGGASTTTGAVGRAGATGDPVPGAGTMAVASGAQGSNGQNGGGATSNNAGGLAGLRGLGASRALAATLPTWNSYASIIGDARMEREADEARRRRSEARGSYTDGWQDTRSAIENFVPHVRIGNQTALRAAASPFAAYLTAMHRRIHRLFADGFIANIPSSPALQNDQLVTTLEIVLEGTGAIHSVGVAHPSGVLAFDVGALGAVRRSAPFGEAPAAIRSYDGRVYVRWGFHRDHRQCGTFNAEPYILPTPAAPTGPRTPPVPPRSTDEGPAERLGQAPGAGAGRGSPG